ncbi:MAG: hypothetical protein K9G58_11030 [Bacteroidales bacterium]|nr:hypothetical protein [Bacteroidales bacterium]MCF8387428.1 hypothetical protein [Bacteroidales bacterium]MCF8398697.1 hypothetical protein [Bacteroidales bacterium]
MKKFKIAVVALMVHDVQYRIDLAKAMDQDIGGANEDIVNRFYVLDKE